MNDVQLRFPCRDHFDWRRENLFWRARLFNTNGAAFPG
jgi:hypothetical protein